MKCKKCNDTGVVVDGCCSGYECGCLGMPVMFINCKCGQKPSNYEAIEKIYGEMSEYLEWRVKDE